jgi:hypothetical protein
MRVFWPFEFDQIGKIRAPRWNKHTYTDCETMIEELHKTPISSASKLTSLRSLTTL